MTVDLLKKHLRIEPDSDSDDEYLALLLESSKYSISNRINQAVEGAVRHGEIRGESDDVPPPLINAVLIMAATLYFNREAVAYGSPLVVPYAIEYLITPYIIFR